MFKVLREVQRSLALAWLAALLIGILMIAFAMQRFGDRFSELVGWYSQAMLPTMTLLIASFYAGRSSSRRVNSKTAWVAMLSGCAYLCFVLGALWGSLGRDVPACLISLNRWSLILALLQVPLDAALVFAAVKAEP